MNDSLSVFWVRKLIIGAGAVVGGLTGLAVSESIGWSILGFLALLGFGSVLLVDAERELRDVFAARGTPFTWADEQHAILVGVLLAGAWVWFAAHSFRLDPVIGTLLAAVPIGFATVVGSRALRDHVTERRAFERSMSSDPATAMRESVAYEEIHARRAGKANRRRAVGRRGVVVFTVVWNVALLAYFGQAAIARREIKDASRAYIEALAGGDGDAAYRHLCAGARTWATPQLLRDAAVAQGPIVILAGDSSGTTADYAFFLSTSGKAIYELRVGRATSVRILHMRRENGWKVCPADPGRILGM